MTRLSRRSFVGGVAVVGASVLDGRAAMPVAGGPRNVLGASSGAGFFDLMRVPDGVGLWVEGSAERVALSRAGSKWSGAGVEVGTEVGPARISGRAGGRVAEVKEAADGESAVAVSLRAAGVPVMRLMMRWRVRPMSSMLYMGDAWERSYGELAWRTTVPERVMPWYFAAHEVRTGRGRTHGYGVETGAGAFCFWQVDAEGVSLSLDVSNGGMGVQLGERVLAVARVVSREGLAGEDAGEAIARLCRRMCKAPRLPDGPVFGTNDWYYAYGQNTAAGILRDTDLVVGLSAKAGAGTAGAGTGGVMPYSVIDAGWQVEGGEQESARRNARFPDMGGLAAEIRKRGARPGIWIRPLDAPKGVKREWLLSQGRYRRGHTAVEEIAYDPTVPEGLAAAVAKMTEVVDWGYELVKHDFSTYDLFGQWGFEMGAQPAKAGWHFHDRSRTSAEIVVDLYQALRKAAGEKTVLLGCNTVAHLGAGIFEVQRTGDDTSGRLWERTRRMGVNTVAYRLPQNGTFHIVDADCVGITKAIPWKLNQQWMDLLARSGTALFISPSPDAIGEEQRRAIAEAFAVAAAFGSGAGRAVSGRAGSAHTGARALDWMETTVPERWEFGGGKGTVVRRYVWDGEEGADAFRI